MFSSVTEKKCVVLLNPGLKGGRHHGTLPSLMNSSWYARYPFGW